MIQPYGESMGDSGHYDDEALLRSLPEAVRYWVERELVAGQPAPGARPTAEAVRRYLVALVRITTLTCPTVTKQATAEALGLPFTPDPTASLVSDNDFAAIVQAGVACTGLN